MTASFHRVLMALLGVGLTVLVAEFIGWGVFALACLLVLALGLAWPLLQLVFGARPRE